jgi:hypothetical protein
MCDIYNGLYEMAYEIDGGRTFAPGESKDLVLRFVNCTGAIKFIIDLVVESDTPDVGLRAHGQSKAAVRVEGRVRLPQAYWNYGVQFPVATQATWRAEISVASETSVPMDTFLKGTAHVRPVVSRRDSDGRVVTAGQLRKHTFDPPVVAK